MNITVSVKLEDGTQITRPIHVDSGCNPSYWAGGVERGINAARDQLVAMVKSSHGNLPGGVHLVDGKRAS